MKKNNSLIVIVVLIIAALALYLVYKPAPSTPAPSPTTGTFDQSISDGTITVAYPSKDFGLATNMTQILVHSYIPPCDSNFNYCLYYIGTAYAGTNFESTGLRIEKRADLATERLCLDTPPAGFLASTEPSSTKSADIYSSSVFANVGDAGAGHIASGSLYRLFYRTNNSCYEFETRIGQTQFANYPPGSIKEFTSADQAALLSKINEIVSAIMLPGGEKNLF